MGIYRELPTDGTLYDLHACTYEYKPTDETSILEHPKSDKFIRGVVKEASLPKEGGILKMHYHKTTNKVGFGAIKLSNCKNVIEEDGNFYLESKSLKYVLLKSINN